MNAPSNFITRKMRCSAAARTLARFGINAKKFWLLVDLFEQIAERREFITQFGRDEFSMKAAAGMLVVYSVLLAVLAVAMQMPASFLLISAAFMTGFVVLLYSLGEAGNSLVSPGEALILAHQPIDGATYTAAKLSHLLKLLVYLVLAANLLPALAGLGLKSATWGYPFRHLSLAFALGLLVQLFVCALYGWLVRVVPPERLKSISNVTDILLILALVGFAPARQAVQRFLEAHSIALDPSAKLVLLATLALASVAFVIFGIRALRGDFLIKVASITHGRLAVRRAKGTSWLGVAATRLFGGPPGRAGFEYTQRVMRRDWMFLKQLAMVAYLLAMMGAFLVRDVSKSPFAAEFSGVHAFPHVLGACAFIVCMMMPYGTDFKGAWVFQTVAPSVFDSFARGVHGVLWLVFVVLPHLILLPFILWFWDLPHALLFAAYSVVFVALYLALEIRIISRIPFSAQLDPKRGAMMASFIFGGAFVIAIIVGLNTSYSSAYRLPWPCWPWPSA